MTCYTESYQSWEVVTAGQVVYAYQPSQGSIGYETGMWQTGCWYDKCPNGYVHMLSNQHCDKGHRNSGTWAPGYPACPHGMLGGGSTSRFAHCHYDTEYYEPGYRAPCGRTTHTEGDIYGYVTRTRTHTGCHSTISQ